MEISYERGCPFLEGSDAELFVFAPAFNGLVEQETAFFPFHQSFPGVRVKATPQVPCDLQGSSLIVKELSLALTSAGQRSRNVNEPFARWHPVSDMRSDTHRSDFAGCSAHKVLL